MLLKGSCHCKKVRFELHTDLYYPYMLCYCTICRKTNGSAFGCNIKGARKDLKVLKGKAFIKTYCGKSCDRQFCGECGSPLFITDESWPDGVWPNAACIDTPLPAPPEYQHIFLDDKAKWFPADLPGQKFRRYPKWSIEEFHEHWGLVKRKKHRK